jgi:hypothetical protein
LELDEDEDDVPLAKRRAFVRAFDEALCERAKEASKRSSG